MVHRSVAATRQPVRRAFRVTRGPLDGSGAVVGREAILVREPCGVTGVSDQDRGDNVSDPEDVGERGAGSTHRSADLGPGSLALLVETIDVVDQLQREPVTDPGRRGGQLETLEE